MLVVSIIRGTNTLELVHGTMSRHSSRTFARRWAPQPVYMESDVYFLCRDDLIDRYVKTMINCNQPKTFGVLQQDEDHQTLFILSKKSTNIHTVLASLTTSREFSGSVGNFKTWYSFNFPDKLLSFHDPYCVAVLKKY